MSDAKGLASAYKHLPAMHAGLPQSYKGLCKRRQHLRMKEVQLVPHASNVRNHRATANFLSCPNGQSGENHEQGISNL